jgi:type I restriction enzyme M protein
VNTSIENNLPFEIDAVVIRRTVDTARSILRSRGVSEGAASDSLGQLFLWIKLSADKLIAPEWNLYSNRERWTDDRLLAVENYFFLSENRLWALAFSRLSERFSADRGSHLAELISMVIASFSKGAVDWDIVIDSILAGGTPGSLAASLVPTEVANLSLQLAAINESELVYCPFQSSLRFALQASKEARLACFEMQFNDPLVACILALSPNYIESSFSDPILSPTYIESGRLKQFDVTLACGPFGGKLQVHAPDEFGRFNGRNSNIEVINLRHILAQTARFAIAVVLNGVLFRTSQSERELKEEVVKNGWLKAVIALPSGLLGQTQLPINLLVFDKQNTSSDVLFIDASTESFFETRKDRRLSRNKLVNGNEIIELFKARSDNKRSRVISKEDCEKNDYDLSPNRYVLSTAQEESEQFLSKHASVTLSDIAEIIRGQAVKPGTDKLQHCFFEVGAADIGRDGIVRIPEKKVFVDSKDLRKVEGDLGLLPGDIVMSVKGSVGILGLVQPVEGHPDGYLIPVYNMETGEPITDGNTENAAQLFAPTNFIVGQSYVIIRPKCPIVIKGESPRKGIESTALLMYLRSPMVQSWIESKMSGTTVPNLQKQYINSLPVILPTLDEEEKLVERHRDIVSLFQNIEQIEMQIGDILQKPLFDR